MKRASVKREDSKLALQCLQIQLFFRREVVNFVVGENYLFSICNLQHPLPSLKIGGELSGTNCPGGELSDIQSN